MDKDKYIEQLENENMQLAQDMAEAEESEQTFQKREVMFIEVQNELYAETIVLKNEINELKEKLHNIASLFTAKDTAHRYEIENLEWAKEHLKEVDKKRMKKTRKTPEGLEEEKTKAEMWREMEELAEALNNDDCYDDAPF